MESKDYLLMELKEIEDWEKDQKGLFIWEKIGRIPFKVLDKITPSFNLRQQTLLGKKRFSTSYRQRTTNENQKKWSRNYRAGGR